MTTLLPDLEALVRIAQCKPNGYIHARSARIVDGKTIWYQHHECFYHFTCRAFLHFAEPGMGYLTEHHKGLTDRVALTETVTNMFRTNRLQVIAVLDYDGRYQSECHWCSIKRCTTKLRLLEGNTRYRNGPA